MKREKWRRSRVCLRDKVVAACNSTVAASATLSRDSRALVRQNLRCDIGLSFLLISKEMHCVVIGPIG